MLIFFNGQKRNQRFLFLYDSFTRLLFGVFLNLIKPDEIGKPIANETSLQFRHNELL